MREINLGGLHLSIRINHTNHKAQTVTDAKPCPESADTTYLMRAQCK